MRTYVFGFFFWGGGLFLCILELIPIFCSFVIMLVGLCIIMDKFQRIHDISCILGNFNNVSFQEIPVLGYRERIRTQLGLWHRVNIRKTVNTKQMSTFSKIKQKSSSTAPHPFKPPFCDIYNCFFSRCQIKWQAIIDVNCLLESTSEFFRDKIRIYLSTIYMQTIWIILTKQFNQGPIVSCFTCSVCIGYLINQNIHYNLYFEISQSE